MNSLKRVCAFPIKLEFGSVGLRRGENRSTRRKTSQSKGENQQQTQPTGKTCGVDAIIRTQATLVGGECSHQLSPMRHPFSLTVLTIDRFHMTSRQPYLCTKQWIGGHVCVQKKSCGNWTLFTCSKLSFIPSNLQSCWPRDWKRSIHSSYLANKGEFCSLFPHRANPTNF